MQSTQLTCPHCGALLNFGQAIAAGTALPCLSCGQTLIAPEAAAVEMPAPVPEWDSVTPPPAAITADDPPRLPVPPPAPLPLPVPMAPPNSGRVLVVGGLAFAGVALLMLGGLSLLLWSLFAPAPAAVEITPAPSAANSLPPTPVVAPAVVVESKGKAPADGGDPDVADTPKREIHPPTAPLTARSTKDGGDTRPLPAVAVNVIAGNAPGVEQERIDEAIAKGVRYLKEHQLPDGTWPGGPTIGYTALAGLTFLECKVRTDDPHVQKAAGYVRNNIGNLNATYELSLAILFLDRLGNPKDRSAIQGMALRLLAGQNEGGGWTYASTHLLNPPEMHQLLIFLKSHRPATTLPKVIQPPAGDLGKQATMLKTQAGSDDPFKVLGELMRHSKSLPEVPAFSRVILAPAGEALPRINKPIDSMGSAAEPAKKSDKGAPADKGNPVKKVTPVNPKQLPPALQMLPVVALNWAKGNVNVQRGWNEDNSNTQFALMGLWAARRHEVPTEFSLLLSKQRFVKSQNNGGGWGYRVGIGSSDAMTCVGLLGLAMGHGVLPEAAGKGKLADPTIQAGLTALGQYIGTPSKEPNARPPMQNLYFLWSVERVAMLYDLKTIGGKDWYGWGAQTLLPNQFADGHWNCNRQYHGAADHTDTCFALLFLKRSNLVPDLTENLRLYMVIRDPEAK